MSAITTHVLDLSTGRPAAGVAVVLERRGADGAWNLVAERRTDADGRARDFAAAGRALEAGVHRLAFATGAYFAARQVASFHPSVTIEFTVADATQHHHVPLLLSPFGYSTYRGS